MGDCIVTMSKRIEINGKELVLNKEEEDFLVDSENPYFGIKRDKIGLLIFNIWKDIGHGIFRNNLLYVLEEKTHTFISNFFRNSKGIFKYPYNEKYLLYLLGKRSKTIMKRLKQMKKVGQLTHAIDEVRSVARAVSGMSSSSPLTRAEVMWNVESRSWEYRSPDAEADTEVDADVEVDVNADMGGTSPILTAVAPNDDDDNMTMDYTVAPQAQAPSSWAYTHAEAIRVREGEERHARVRMELERMRDPGRVR